MSISISDYQVELENELKYLQTEIDKINSQIDKINNETEFGKTQINKEFEQSEFEDPDIWLTIENTEDAKTTKDKINKEEILESACEFLNLL